MRATPTPRRSLRSFARHLLARDTGALYVHFQAENGVAHRTFVLSPRRVRALRTLFSAWGVVLALAIAGSWAYFAAQSARVPALTSRIDELESERDRIDTLQVRLLDLQRRYDQVQRMLGVPPPSGASSQGNGDPTPTPPTRVP